MQHGQIGAQCRTICDAYVTDEHALTARLVEQIPLDDHARKSACTKAASWISEIRAHTAQEPLIDSFLREFDLSNDEGVILMRLSEALIRTPDAFTSDLLIRDKIVQGAWDDHPAASERMLVNLGISGLHFIDRWVRNTGGEEARNLLARLGDRVMSEAMAGAMGVIARQFVLGPTIEKATQRARAAEQTGTRHSYDMLGEAARTLPDAETFFAAYSRALDYLASQTPASRNLHDAPSLSVKLSALHPRYELARAHECRPFLLARMLELAARARDAGLGLIIDAEEADRLELSLAIFADLLAAPGFAQWEGLGIVVQAYQRRSLPVIEHVRDLAQSAKRKICVRLVKGAYWDMEIKRAQELGLDSYPVFTRKEHSDISFLAGARELLRARDRIFPQFATHNALSAAMIVEMAGKDLHGFEFQRLHGMGALLHDLIARETGIASRVYAPVGAHSELLPYLVRRLLENGANSSFVNQLSDEDVPVSALVCDPVTLARAHGGTPHPGIKAPCDQFEGERLSASGCDFTQDFHAARLAKIAAGPHARIAIDGALKGEAASITNPADKDDQVGTICMASSGDIPEVIAKLDPQDWAMRPAQERARALQRVADLMQEKRDELMLGCVREAGKTWADAQAELREAVDFCRYYALEAARETHHTRAPLGIVACISPWNFPLAIYTGQIAAALVMGNAVIAKPAHQTPLIAHRALELFYEAGVSDTALQMVAGGRDVGANLVSAPQIDAVCFTGSTRAARQIARSRAHTGQASAPLIAETGGINAMIIDSTALLEQAVKDTIDSAFQSAGQRCSACRLVCVQEDIAEAFCEMLRGAMAMLRLGDPAQLSTDIGPLIDAEAHQRIGQYIDTARTRFKTIAQAPLPAHLNGWFVAPIAFEIANVAQLEEEIFGPVLHIVRFQASALDRVIADINASGFGLTMGLHTRIDARIDQIAQKARVGNLYVNRNQIGAVVGVQPFGGEGLSGTGPKAGGLHYLKRLSAVAQNPRSHATDAPSLSARPLNPAAKNAIAQARAQFAAAAPEAITTQLLPGPTGEKNTLSLYPRGLLLCAGDCEKPEALQAMIDRVWETGNLPLICAMDAACLQDETAEAITIVDAASPDIARYGEIEGVVTSDALAASYAAVLAEREGALLPVLTPGEETYRFCHERCLTIDTTAAGGNASLMTI